VKRTIAEKNALLGAKRKFALVVGAKIRPASAAKNAKRCIIGFDIEKFFRGCSKVENFGG
jgi:hypothetical protein